MSGIFGCWRLDTRPVIGIELQQCLAQILPLDSQTIEYWMDGPIGLGHKFCGTRGTSTVERQWPPNDQAAAFFVGRLDNRSELCRALSDHTPRRADCTDGNLVAAAYDRWGDTFIDHIDGDFALAVFDRRLNRLVLARDRVGLGPLCYTRTSDVLLFGSNAKALLAYPGIKRSPDETALADFILYSLPADAGTRTCFEGIHSLPPGHLLIATVDGLTVRRYFEFDTTRRLRFDDVRDYAAALHDLFAASVRKRLRGDRPVAIEVSGGLDSSYIFCTAQRLVREEPGLCPAVIGLNYDGATGTPSDERYFIEEIERAWHAKIARVPELAGFVEGAAEEVWRSESPHVDRLARLGHEMRDRARGAGAGRLLTGHWGDQVMSDSDYLLDLLRSGRWSLLRQHAEGWRVGVGRLAARVARDVAIRRLPARVLSRIRLARHRSGAWQSAWFTPRFRRLLRDRHAAERLRRWPGTHHARAIYQQIRLPYHVSCMEWNVRVAAGHGLEMAFPYLDGDLLQFLISIPGDVQSHDGIPRGLLRQAMRGTVPDAIVDRRTKGEFTHLGKQSIDGDFALIADLLGPTALSVRFGYIDGPVLWQRLDLWRAAMRADDDAVVANRLTDLCGLELMLRRFFSDWEPGAVPLPSS